MKIYTTVNDSNLQFKRNEVEMEITYRSSVASVADLPSSENTSGDARLVLDSDHLYVYVTDAWYDQGMFDVQDLLQERLMQSLS